MPASGGRFSSQRTSNRPRHQRGRFCLTHRPPSRAGGAATVPRQEHARSRRRQRSGHAEQRHEGTGDQRAGDDAADRRRITRFRSVCAACARCECSGACLSMRGSPPNGSATATSTRSPRHSGGSLGSRRPATAPRHNRSATASQRWCAAARFQIERCAHGPSLPANAPITRPQLLCFGAPDLLSASGRKPLEVIMKFLQGPRPRLRNCAAVGLTATPLRHAQAACARAGRDTARVHRCGLRPGATATRWRAGAAETRRPRPFCPVETTRAPTRAGRKPPLW